MAKKILTYIKLHIEAGKATPAPPVGPALGQRGVNIMEFTKAFNEKTKDKMGFKVPVVITVYTDKSFTFITKQPPASALLMRAAGLKKGTDNPLKNIIGKITRDQLMEVVKQKMEDLNTTNVEMAVNTISGSARSIGIQIVD
ncbi:50S ribosomal protein L11 [Sulfurimonas sp.]|uniref:50S ribosomal protein L11 n=1 Tax=Sulfurimonas sp. TaxID=2022749 RepID=UPI0026007793|nr:50S ribosomal protein L11 [Sulfurimonas sp.]MDD5157558.1 50S ribosomal protein L11 [Sulfurimonas sp.]